MNYIHDFALKAAHYANDLTGLRKGDVATKAWIHIYETKLAELILEKVMEICYNDGTLDTYEVRAKTAQDIYEHFYE